MSKEYWTKRNKRTDKISDALDDLIGISALMKKQSTQKTVQQQTKKQRSREVTITIDNIQHNATIQAKKQKKQAPKKDRVMSWI